MTETLPNPGESEVWQKEHVIVPVPNEAIRRDVLHYAALCLPDRVHWCGGSQQEQVSLNSQAAAEANTGPSPGWVIGQHQASKYRQEAVPARLAGADSKGSLRHLFHESMKGRTMYVVPFLLPAEGDWPEVVGVQLTDSAALASSIETAFPSGDRAWVHLASGKPFWLCLHACGNQELPDDRVRWELPVERTLWAYGGGYEAQTLRRVLRQA